MGGARYPGRDRGPDVGRRAGRGEQRVTELGPVPSGLDSSLAEQFRQTGSLEGPVRLFEQAPIIGASTQSAELAAEAWLVKQ